MNTTAKRRGAEDAEAQISTASGLPLRLCVSAINITFPFTALLVCVALTNTFAAPLISQEKSLLRIAVIGFTRMASNYDERAARMLEDTLNDSLRSDASISLIERSMFQPALAGIGYEGSINMSREEARRIGAAVGCDFFITGKAETVTRSERKGETHIEAIIGVMIVDGRSGDLAYFDFIEEKAESVDTALSKAAVTLKTRASLYAEQMAEWRKRRESSKPLDLHTSGERVEEIPEEGSPQSAGFTPPEFLSRAKPEYTSQAERADISATVEASAVFGSNGEVYDIEITRWAGFGLDQSAIEAIQQLKFKPATRDGKPINVRATVQYNFRRKVAQITSR